MAGQLGLLDSCDHWPGVRRSRSRRDGPRVGPVSYTHLDVYKRQAGEQVEAGQTKTVEDGSVYYDIWTSFSIESAGPVSYTHLDVYKRQEYRNNQR